MNDVICISCGKPNTDKVAICQYCGTALKQSATEPLAPIRTGDMPVKMKTSDLEGTLPGWLRDARKASGEKDSNPAAKVPAVKKVAPASPIDFLTGLSQVGEEEEEAPDWLKSLQNSMPAPVESILPAKAEPVEEQKAPVEEPGPDQTQANWGFGADPSAFAFDEDSEPGEQAEQETPGWMNALNEQKEQARPEPMRKVPAEQPKGDPAIFEDLPDWLAALTESSAVPPIPPARSDPTKQQDDNPDWLSGLGGDFTPDDGSQAAETDPTETLDWLARANQEPSIVSDPGPTIAEKPGVTDNQDWLAELTSGAQPVETSLPATQKADPSLQVDSNMPDWLSNLQDSGQIPDATSGKTSATQLNDPVETTPDWMASLPQASVEPQPSAMPGTDLPSWLADAMNALPSQDAAVASKPFSSGSFEEIEGINKNGELPSWMASLGQPESEPERQHPPSIETSAAIETPVSSAPFLQPSVDLPDWLNNLPAIDNRMTTGAVDTNPVVQPKAVDISASKAPVTPLIPPSVDDQNIDSILSMDMPDWLTGFTGPEKEQKTAQVTENHHEDANLLPAELPSWVQSMRPMESVMAGTRDSRDEQEIEDNGPLAGLQSILPVQSGLMETRKAKTYSIKLLATDTQRAQALLLENLVNSESEPQQVPKSAKTLIIRPLRWLIAAVLLIATILPAILGTKIFPSPVLSTQPSALGAFIQTTTNLPDGSVVLVVVDYQPGYAAEMEAISVPLIEQLKTKNIRLAFISTSPVGPFMADRLVQKSGNANIYQIGTQYINLGYLPGGAGGIKIFAELPRYTVGQDSLLGNMWDAPALADVTVNGVTNLANFAAVFVLTDNPDTGRLWIEQAQPLMEAKPFLLVVSAQAEPMVRPYMLSGQVVGILAGLEGGAMLENALGKDGLARADWDAFGAAMLTAELLISIGGVWGLVVGLRARRINAKQDEA